jgi:hypothetical protein
MLHSKTLTQKVKRAEVVLQEIEVLALPSKFKALSSNPSIRGKKVRLSILLIKLCIVLFFIM